MPKNTKKACSAVGAAEQATGVNFIGQVPVEEYTTCGVAMATIFERGRTRFLDLIPEGAENAIPKVQLAEMMGLPDRALRLLVHKERRMGHQILTNCESGGYYRPATPDESMRFVRSMRHRAAETVAVADAIEAAVLEETGQTKIRGV